MGDGCELDSLYYFFSPEHDDIPRSYIVLLCMPSKRPDPNESVRIRRHYPVPPPASWVPDSEAIKFIPSIDNPIIWFHRLPSVLFSLWLLVLVRA